MVEKQSVSAENENPPSILVVDDNPLIVSVLDSLFKSENYNVKVACDGQEAIEALDSHPVDVIICDVMMPKLDGYGFHDKVRGEPKFAHIPFVFLTALGESAEVKRGREAGADDYLTKPFDPQQMLSLIRGKVRRSRQTRQQNEEQISNYRRKVIHTLSHEFRTPLVAINTGAELLLEHKQGLKPERVTNLLEAIRRGGERLEKLVNDFMLLQQYEAGVSKRLFETRAAEYLFSDIFNRILEGNSEDLAVAGFELRADCRCGRARVRVYEPHILDIAARLIENSVKFSRDRKEIELITEFRGETVTLEVQDRGLGMDTEKVKEALAVFGQIDRQKLEQQGGGLGLAICERFASINSGRLEFEAREGGGSTVRLILPILPQPV